MLLVFLVQLCSCSILVVCFLFANHYQLFEKKKERKHMQHFATSSLMRVLHKRKLQLYPVASFLLLIESSFVLLKNG